MRLVLGADVAASAALQLALLTIVNLGVKCFGRTAVSVHADASVWLAPCRVKLVPAATLGDAVVALGGSAEPASAGSATHLVLGDAPTGAGSLRVTFDGWVAAVGLADQLPRMPERPTCPLASIAAAALSIGEIFSAYAGISLMATRQTVGLSLWRPDLGITDPAAFGESLELPSALSVFGLGHLGQAYLWALAALPYARPEDVCLWLCDDDAVEEPNVETGALLAWSQVGELKTRVAAKWLEDRGFSTRLLERRVDAAFRRTNREPAIALSGFDDNWPRRWLAEAGFELLIDSGLGGEAHNFDTIAFRAWPNPRRAADLWPVETDDERRVREARKQALVEANAGYSALGANECGRLTIAGASVAVPFVGAIASCTFLAEMLKSVNGHAGFDELKLRVCLLGNHLPQGARSGAARTARGLRTTLAQYD